MKFQICVPLLLAFIFTHGSLAKASKSDRTSDRGFIMRGVGEKLFFVHEPLVLDPGVEIKDGRVLKKNQFCIVTKRTLPVECPPQEVSFALERKSGIVVITDLRLEAETSWHRLNRKQKLLTE